MKSQTVTTKSPASDFKNQFKDGTHLGHYYNRQELTKGWDWTTKSEYDMGPASEMPSTGLLTAGAQQREKKM